MPTTNLPTYSLARDSLRPIMALLSRVAQKSSQPVLHAVQLGDGLIATNNLTLSAAYALPELDGPKYGVDCAVLADACRRADAGSVLTIIPPAEIPVEGKRPFAAVKAIVKGVAISFPAAWYPGDELPALAPPDAKFPALAQPFDAVAQACFHRAMLFVSTDDNRAILRVVCLDRRQPEGRIVATDGRRLYASRAFHWLGLPAGKDIKVPPHPIWAMPVLAGLWLLRYSEAEDGLSSVLEMRTGSWRMVTRLETGNYPNWQNVVDSNRRDDSEVAVAEIDPDSAPLLIAQLSALPSDERQSHTTVEVESNGVLRLAHPPTSTVITANAQTLGPTVKAAFNSEFLCDALRVGCVIWKLRDELSPLCAYNRTGDTLIVMPLRLGPTPEEVAADEAAAAAKAKADEEAAEKFAAEATAPAPAPAVAG